MPAWRCCRDYRAHQKSDGNHGHCIAEAHDQAKPVPLTAQEGLANAEKWECRQDAQTNDPKTVCIRHELSPPFEDLRQHENARYFEI